MQRFAGVSVYPGEAEMPEVLEYLERAAALGYKYVFTSMHITEQDPLGAVAFVREAASAARRSGLEVVADVSPRSFQATGAAPANLEPLSGLGLAGIRVDFGYGEAEIAAMTRERSGMKIVINASTVNARMLAALRRSGADFSGMEACHNYYPRPETGLSLEFVRKSSRLLVEYGLRVWAFVPSAAGRRGPLRLGLPTVERHRGLPVSRAAAEFLASGAVDVLVFGDPGASADELRSMASVWLGGSVPLRVALNPGVTAVEREIVFGGVHENRLDPAEMVLRSSASRRYAQQGAEVPPREAVERPAYSVTVDNGNYLRYSGELQVTLVDLPADPRVNVVGRVVEEDRPLVDMLGPGSRFHFVERGYDGT